MLLIRAVFDVYNRIQMINAQELLFFFNVLVCCEVDALRTLLAAGADITRTDLNGGSPVKNLYFS